MAPLKVAEVQTTAILVKSGEEIEKLARLLGRLHESNEIAAMNAKSRQALLAQWRPELRRFVSRDLISGEDVQAPTQAGFIPRLALDLDATICDAACEEMKLWSNGMIVAFPSRPKGYVGFEPKRYWRGPSWAIINWLLIDGLKRNGLLDMAEYLCGSTVRAIETNGFAEYFDPLTGEGCRGLDGTVLMGSRLFRYGAHCV